ncbi:MAG: NAD(P)H-hydrate dehydratase [Solirubrobacteraceae bacterium]|nr:NAD(P)H-hydrate dehydratase [Solirubrobacteraceae bacterium]
MIAAGWLQALLDAERARTADRWAIDELGIPSLELMERASVGLAGLVGEVAPEGRIAVVCGGGNNGGDGYAAARLLRDSWRDVVVLAAVPPADLRGDARVQVERLPGEPPEPFDATRLAGTAVVVDALLGTGFSGSPRGPVGEAVAVLEGSGLPVVACDVPSGVDASTGEVAGPAVRAVATATFHAVKPGLVVNPGKARAGSVRLVDIGIPTGAPIAPPDSGLMLDAPLLAELPERAPGWTKFTSGHVLVAGGSRGLTGATVLGALAAMRAGAGYVTVCVPASQQPALAAQLVEVMQLALDDEGGHHTPAGAEAVLAEAERRGGALVLGPGLGKDEGAAGFAREVAARAQVPLLLDADGLNAHAERLPELALRGSATVLTPHDGELGRLLGVPSGAVAAHRLRHARDAARRSGAIVVLKGDDTLVAAPDGAVAISPGATPALATAGTGDVLSGVAGALLARGLDPFLAACAAVRLHARAGLIAAERRGVDGVIARDVVEALPQARTAGVGA